MAHNSALEEDTARSKTGSSLIRKSDLRVGDYTLEWIVGSWRVSRESDAPPPYPVGFLLSPVPPT
jgi:hypothetical protein